MYKYLLEAATSYEQWAAAATILDTLEGNDRYKQDPSSPFYDFELLSERLKALREARKRNDAREMIYLLRTSLHRNLGDMSNRKLYMHCRIGTKKLIEEYIDEVCLQLHDLVETEFEDFSGPEKYDFFVNTQKSFGRTALLLSGGGTFGLIHIGVLRTLYEQKLLPRVISGASVGSLIAAAVCCRTDEELVPLINPDSMFLDVFEDPSEAASLLTKLVRFVKQGVIFDVKVLAQGIRRNVGDLTFLEAFNRTRRILNITVSSSTGFQSGTMLNYITAPNVLIWSAVAASCSIPILFKATPLMAKDKQGNMSPWTIAGDRWIDGSVQNDLPMQRLREMFNVNHFIVSQVNPHIMPFITDSLSQSSIIGKAFGSVTGLMRSELQLRLHQLVELGFGTKDVHNLQAISSQQYYGDITIVPQVDPRLYLKIVQNPSKEVVEKFIRLGEQATWPLVSMIRNHCAIELEIDAVLYRMRVQKLRGTSLRNGATLHASRSGDALGDKADWPRTVRIRSNMNGISDFMTLSKSNASAPATPALTVKHLSGYTA